MLIQSITAENFKSLVDFRMDLAKFTCLIGLNGSGKSTVLQLMDFLGQQVRGNIDGWLSEREWNAEDIRSKFFSRSTIKFSVRCGSAMNGLSPVWEASFDSSKRYCTVERIRMTDGTTLEVVDGRLRIREPLANGSGERTVVDEEIAFSYQGSVLSQLKPDILPVNLAVLAAGIRHLRSLDLLSPERLRKRSREAVGSLGLGGSRLSAFLYQMGPEKRQRLAQHLKYVYPQLHSINSVEEVGWRQLAIEERYSDQSLVTDARHVNDGMLRLIAILSELDFDSEILLLDELENGINPEIVEFLVAALVAEPKQVVATTHSPMILNYLDDATARAGVIYLYKTPLGHTRAIPFFSIPSLAKKLAVMGPGEAFADTNLTALADEIADVTGEQV